MLRIVKIQPEDLVDLPSLQPPDWADIRPNFSFYLQSPFCRPHKAVMDGVLVGVGNLSVFAGTGWLAHVIVHQKCRRQGIGSRIVAELLALCRGLRVETVLLAATALGRPVYHRAGFRTVGRYLFLAREKPWRQRPLSPQIVPLCEAHHKAVLALDGLIAGERRASLLSGFFEDGLVYLSEGEVSGVYLPRLKEGYIGALDEAAGLALLEVKYAWCDGAVVPERNRAALRFLQRNGFSKTGRVAYRMVLGQDVAWRPELLYGRVGGNFG